MKNSSRISFEMTFLDAYNRVRGPHLIPFPHQSRTEGERFFHEQKIAFERDRGVVINWITIRSCRGICRTSLRKTLSPLRGAITRLHARLFYRKFQLHKL